MDEFIEPLYQFGNSLKEQKMIEKAKTKTKTTLLHIPANAYSTKYTLSIEVKIATHASRAYVKRKMDNQ